MLKAKVLTPIPMRRGSRPALILGRGSIGLANQRILAKTAVRDPERSRDAGGDMEGKSATARARPPAAAESRPRRSVSRRAPGPPHPKTAVIVIHGMGEQWPMETLRGFVDAAWRFDDDLSEPWSEGETYSKPERITGNFELRRITTRYWKHVPGETDPPRRVDFFEFYWAHLMQGNTLASVTAWLVRLLVSKPSRVPRRLLGGWIAGLLLLIAGFMLALLTAVRPDLTRLGVPIWAWSVLAAVGAAFSAAWLRPVAGDAARYLSPMPGNVAARQAIREAGIDLLTKIQDTGEYDRIIVAGHSLGSVIGYDVLNYTWGRLDQKSLAAAHPAGSPTMTLLAELEKSADRLEKEPTPASLAEYRDLQRRYFRSLSTAKASNGRPLWLVSDFVTLGSPLSSSDVLLAKDRKTLDRKVASREIPSSPPQSEREKAVRFSYPPDAKARTPHHGAAFAPTVWTNIFYPNVLGIIGDFVSGPVAPLLGPAVRDVRVPIGFPTFRHLSYWARPERGWPAIRALRHALNLRERGERALWRDLAEANPIDAERLPETPSCQDLVP